MAEDEVVFDGYDGVNEIRVCRVCGRSPGEQPPHDRIYGRGAYDDPDNEGWVIVRYGELSDEEVLLCPREG